MYAIIDIKGTQLIVEKDEVVQVNKLADAEKIFKVDKVLFGKKGSTLYVGDPYVKDAFVECEVIGDTRGDKKIAFKYRERKSSQSTRGHRQDLTELRIKEIYLGGSDKETTEKAVKPKKTDLAKNAESKKKIVDKGTE